MNMNTAVVGGTTRIATINTPTKTAMNRTVIIVRWIARIISVLILLFWGYFIVAHLIDDAAQFRRLTPNDSAKFVKRTKETGVAFRVVIRLKTTPVSFDSSARPGPPGEAAAVGEIHPDAIGRTVIAAKGDRSFSVHVWVVPMEAS
jgi:hypothetical protein